MPQLKRSDIHRLANDSQKIKKKSEFKHSSVSFNRRSFEFIERKHSTPLTPIKDEDIPLFNITLTL